MALLAQLAAATLLIAAIPTSPTSTPNDSDASAHRTIATTVAGSQAAFDRGLLLAYAFNVGEARLSFTRAEALDPNAVMPYVGEAIAQTIDINRPTTSEGERRGAEAIARGRAAAASAPDDERALYAAVAQRYDLKRSQHDRFTTYFQALQTYADAHPTDGMALTLAAYAGWNATNSLTEGTQRILTPTARTIANDLERAIALDPRDLGAHHLRIHFWEQVDQPQQALPDADILAAVRYEPGESHLEHMAGHIYDRLGDYSQMIDVNIGACANDARYFAAGHGAGQQYMRNYHEHNVDFVLYGLTTLGENMQAQAYAARESTYAREITALRVHDNEAVLRDIGDVITPLRVVAEARSGHVRRARSDLAALGSDGSEVALALASAAVAQAVHDDRAAIAAYRQAQAAVGHDLGDPKVQWFLPIGEGLGALLLMAHDPSGAQLVFQRELLRYPHDPHLEFGLACALADQGIDNRAAQHAYESDWKGDRPLVRSDLG